MRAQTTTAGPLAAGSATAIRTASSAPSGALVLNGTLANAAGTIATMDHPRRVLLTFAANETGHTFTLTGTGPGGVALRETIAGTTAGTVQSVLDYSTVSVSISATSTGNVSVGTNGVGSSGWLLFDQWLSDGVVAFQCTVSGTVNYTVQQSLDNPNNLDAYGAVLLAPSAVTWVNCSDTNVVAATSTQQSNYNFAPFMMRVVMNSGTGTVTLTAIQHGGS
jgi:hypothetical protein